MTPLDCEHKQMSKLIWGGKGCEDLSVAGHDVTPDP